MDKAMKIPLIALFTLTTQIVILIGNTTISKSAEHKPTGNIHKEISQTYYDRIWKNETLPVMYEQEKPTELRSQSFSDQYNRQEQTESQRILKCDQQYKYYEKIGYGRGSFTYYIGKNNEVYKWNVNTCKSTLIGYVGGRSTGENGEPCDYISSRGAYCIQWNLENNMLCKYRGFDSGRVEKSYCENKN